MTKSAPMSLPDALREMRRPCATATKCGEITNRAPDFANHVQVALWPYGMGHGGTAMSVTLDREMALALQAQLARALSL